MIFCRSFRTSFFLFCGTFILLFFSSHVLMAKPQEPPSDDKARDITDQIKLAAKFIAAYNLSDLDGSDQLNGYLFEGLLAPHYKVTDSSRLILMYNGSYSKKREFYSDDIGPQERVEYQSHNITPIYRKNFGDDDRYSITPSFFYTTTYNKDFEDSNWSDGLYNYNDIGVSIDFRDKKLSTGNITGSLKTGLQVYTREYPNYQSLLDLAEGLNTEEDERDYLGIAFNVGYDWFNKTGFSFLTEYTLLDKMLKDKKVVDANGVLTGKKQQDYFHSLDVGVWYIFKLGLRLGIDFNTGVYQSNQNYYDGMGTITLDDDVFTPNFYNYFSYMIRPNIAYKLADIPLVSILSYTVMKTDYSDRRAKYSNGQYKTDKQNETNSELLLRLQYELDRHWQLYGQYQRIDNDSNNEDERVYVYDYTVNNYSLGCSYEF